MNDPMPLYYFLFFVSIWLVVCAGLSHLSGWRKLAKVFKATKHASGHKFYFVTAMVGKGSLMVKFGSTLFVTVNDQGIRLSVLWVFGMFCPALLIPWDQIEVVDSKGLSLSPFGGATIKLRGHDEVIVLSG